MIPTQNNQLVELDREDEICTNNIASIDLVPINFKKLHREKQKARLLLNFVSRFPVLQGLSPACTRAGSYSVQKTHFSESSSARRIYRPARLIIPE